MWLSPGVACFTTGTAPGAQVAAVPGDSADSPGPWDTALPPGETHLADATARITGEPSSAAGNAIALGADPEGDGASVVVAAYFKGIVCQWDRGPVGEVTLADADHCIRSSLQSEYFGFAVAAGGDLTGDDVPDLVASAVGDSTAGPYTGRVDIYAGPLALGEFGTEVAVARLSGEVNGDYAGGALALAGDTDGDGLAELFVGAAANDEAGSGAGKAYLVEAPLGGAGSLGDAAIATFTGEGADLAGPPPPPHAPPSDGDGVGGVLDAAGDLDGDGLDDLALGMNGRDPGGVSNAGAVCAFLGPIVGALTLEDADRTWTGTRTEQYVGDAVAGVGDVDGDGDDDLATASDTDGPGTAWILGEPGPVTTAWAYAEGETLGDLAGTALAGAGDVDGDGALDILVGAFQSDIPEQDAGGAYLWLGPFSPGRFALADAAWIGRGERDGDQAGRAVAAGRDVDDDGVPDLLVGAMYYDGDSAFLGAAYLVTGLYSR